MNLLKEASLKELKDFIDSVLPVDEIRIGAVTLQGVTNVKIRDFSKVGLGDCVTLCFSFGDVGNTILEFNPKKEKLEVFTQTNEGNGIDLVFNVKKQ